MKTKLFSKIYNDIIDGNKEVRLENDVLFNLCDRNIKIIDIVNNDDFKNDISKYGLFEIAYSYNNVNDYLELGLYPYTKKEVDNFINLCLLNQSDLKKKVSRMLKTTYENVIETDDYIVATGNIPITLVAHLDTVFYNKNKREDIYINNNIITSNYGLGGDDRCGVFIILNIIKNGFRPNVIFTTNEEIGCLGAKALSNNLDIEVLGNSKYLIELDRKGDNDAVFYECHNQTFIDYIIKNFRFTLGKGTSTDIKYLAPILDIAAVNISCGYYNPHRNNEYVDLNVMKLIQFRITYMLNNLPNIKYKF